MVSEAGADQSRTRRRIPACLRCRHRKTKCDNKLPTCSNCERAGVPCNQGENQDRIRADQLQSRVELLEDLLKTHAPHIQREAIEIHQQPRNSGVARRATAEDHCDGNHLSLQGISVTGAASPNHSLQPSVTAEPPSNHGPTNGVGNVPAMVLVPRNQTITTPTRPEEVASSDTPQTTLSESRIGPEQPIAHDVGLLSLGNPSSDPKYLGPSSGVSFARLLYAAAPQSQGLPASTSDTSLHEQRVQIEAVSCAPLPTVAQMHRFVDSYLETFNHIYPFLKEDVLNNLIDQKCSRQSAQQEKGDVDLALLFLVAALGARNLERSLDTELRSNNYLASAMAEISRLQLHDSLKGIQIMLLLVLASFWFPRGLNAWYLIATIIASCLDLGLQRKRVAGPRESSASCHLNTEEEDTRSSIFWCAYSLERTLSTTLGRPLTLRDEAIDVEFPGETGTGLSSYPATVIPSPLQDVDFFSVQSFTSAQLVNPSEGPPPPKKTRVEHTVKPDYAAGRFSFRFDRITAEIKLMLYRVVQLPSRFPWPTDLSSWQLEAYEACNSLLATAKRILSYRGVSHGRCRRALPAIELKYHQCVLLLFRPSPAFRSPTADALAICHMSALEVIKIHAEQLRFGELADTWLTAHLVFISGITVIYTAWVLPSICNRAAIPGASNFTTLEQPVTDALENGIKSCSELLEHLGQTWSVARDAKEKFDSLGSLTLEAMRNGSIQFTSENNTNSGAHPAPRILQSENTGTGLPAANDLDTSWMNSGDGFVFGDLLDPPEFLDQLGDFSTSYDFGWMTDPMNPL